MPRTSLLFGAPALLFILLVSSLPLSADSGWRKLSTPQFTLVTHTTDGLTRDVATDLTDFISLLDRLLVVKAADRKPLTVVLFDNDGEFIPFKPLATTGRDIDTVQLGEGLYTVSNTRSGAGWTAIVAAGQNREQQTSRGVFAGAVDWDIDAVANRVPLAVRKGVSTVLATSRRQLTHAELGAPIGAFVGILDHGGLMPVTKLLVLDNPLELIEGHDRLLFDAESWGLVHYLMFSKETAQRHAFDLFWQALQSGASAHDALVRALGPDGADRIDVDLKSYMSGQRYIVKIAMGEKVRNHDAIVPAEPFEVEVALAKAALIGNRTLAAQHIDAAIAAGGNRPEPFELRAEELHSAKMPGPDFRTAVDDAISRGSRNGSMYLWSARFALGEAGKSGRSPEARSAVNLAEKAVTLDRSLQPAFDFLAQAIGRADHVTDDDGKFLAFGRARFPADRWLLVGEAAYRTQRGEAELAARFRERALANDDSLESEQLPQVRAFLSAHE